MGRVQLCLPVLQGAVLVQLGLVGQDRGHHGGSNKEEDLRLHFDFALVVLMLDALMLVVFCLML